MADPIKKYICRLRVSLNSGLRFTEVELPFLGALALAKNGFWLNSTFEYTTNWDDSVYWIPPSMVECIERVTPEYTYKGAVITY